MDLSLVIPAYNEENTLEAAVEEANCHASEISSLSSFEILIVENGSVDNTSAVAKKMEEEYQFVRYFSLDNAGKGNAITYGIGQSKGSVVAFFDADLATDMKHLKTLYESIALDGFDVATGSRMMPGHEIDRPIDRKILSKGFNGLVRLLLRSSVRDHLCGFKSFDASIAESLACDIRTEGWFWDAELLVLSQLRGYQINEFPVDWNPRGDSSLTLLNDVPSILLDIFRCAWRNRIRDRHSSN